MRRVVSNTSPLIFLAKIDLLEFLSEYDIVVPQQVIEEIEKGILKEKEDASGLLTYLEKAANVKIQTCNIKSNLSASLGMGEKAAISYAIENGIENIWIDEAKARAVARFYNLSPKGTIGILWNAYLAGKLKDETLENKMFELVKKGYRIKEEILINIMEEIKKPK